MTLGSLFTQAFTRPSWDPKTGLDSLSGKVVLVTGASTGLGKETARELAAKGAHVICLGRSVEKTKAAIADIIKATGNEKVEFLQADLMDLKSVEKAADEFLAKKLPLHILVNNAGIMAVPWSLSANGIESQFATNHFAHVLLTSKLLHLLVANQPSRIVNLSSLAHLDAPKDGIHYSELLNEKTYIPWSRYGETKLANIHFTRELQRQLDEKYPNNSIFVNAVHPGVVKTELARDMVDKGSFRGFLISSISINALPGALTQIYAAGSPDIEKNKWKGQYFVPFCSLASPNANGTSAEQAKSTWAWTETILKEKYDPNWTFKI